MGTVLSRLTNRDTVSSLTTYMHIKQASSTCIYCITDRVPNCIINPLIDQQCCMTCTRDMEIYCTLHEASGY